MLIFDDVFILNMIVRLPNRRYLGALEVTFVVMVGYHAAPECIAKGVAM